jgi:hypothetical protein
LEEFNGPTKLATYTALLDHSVSSETLLDSLVSTKDPQLVQIEHTPGESGRKLVENMYPLVAEGINNGLFIPNRARVVRILSLCARVRNRIRRRLSD